MRKFQIIPINLSNGNSVDNWTEIIDFLDNFKLDYEDIYFCHKLAITWQDCATRALDSMIKNTASEPSDQKLYLLGNEFFSLWDNLLVECEDNGEDILNVDCSFYAKRMKILLKNIDRREKQLICTT